MRAMNNLTAFTPDVDISQAWTLPSSWYTDPILLAQEKDKIFFRTWQWVGSVSLVKRAGDYFTYDMYGEPLVITRGQDGVLRGFFNVCLHRAGPVAAGRGNRKSLQCRYHGWLYALDGRLQNAPEFESITSARSRYLGGISNSPAVARAGRV
jgi:choline monooxygenase